jgi:FkbM family methyltransferase
MLKPGDVVLDCGANIGDVAEPLAQTGATVIAFEPDPYAFGRLKRRLAPYDNVTLHNAAVAVESGTIQLMRTETFEDDPESGSVKSTIIKGGRKIDERDEAGIDVALMSLPQIIRDLVAEHGEIALLKMDIEGAELDLLEHFLAEGLFDPIRLTVAETHENKFRDLRPRFAAMREAVTNAYPITKVNLDWI